jgi:UDP-N-acetyl-D-mannosaminouronate:lipid I N-acetyl-D-mannosaminouronosyltransferase
VIYGSLGLLEKTIPGSEIKDDGRQGCSFGSIIPDESLPVRSKAFARGSENVASSSSLVPSGPRSIFRRCPNMIESVPICQFQVYPFSDMDQICDFVGDRHTLLIALGAEKLLSKDHRFRQIVNGGVGYADGIGTVLALRRKGYHVPKIRGADLWLRMVQWFSDRSIYILGAEESVLSAALAKLTREWRPKIVGARDGFYDDEGFAGVQQELRDKQPEIVFVALGSPKQEYVMEQLFAVHPALYMGIGGSLDLYVGKVPPVPQWWIRVFQWEGLYRQVYDLRNTRRWRRQIRVLPIVWRILTNTL